MKDLLSSEIQSFISEHLQSDPNDLVLRGIPFDKKWHALILNQIKSKKKAFKKLPEWFSSEDIIYPPPIHIEQSSSETTARYKSSLIRGASLIDLTGGFGVDCHFFSERVKTVWHCETNKELSVIANHNANILGRTNIKFLVGDGISILKEMNRSFDWIYLDPSRRSSSKQKVFLLSDCEPNARSFKNLFLKFAPHVMIKTSPLLDLKKTLTDLAFVKEVHIVAVNNEVKELIWILERDAGNSPKVITNNINDLHSECFEFQYEKIIGTECALSPPLAYLYEPNAAILKSGAFNLVSAELEVYKLHQHSHLYTSEQLVTFPGRTFKILNIIPFNKKKFSKEGIKKANVTTRNFPLSVHEIRKKLNIKDGGVHYLFFTTLSNDQKVIIVCSKIQKTRLK